MKEAQKLEKLRAAAESVCRQWQKILRLEDWDIQVDIRSSVDMRLTNSLATVERFGRKRRAHIELLDPREFRQADNTGDLDVESSIVHELLHIYTQPMMRKCPKDSELEAEEQAIHAISMALLKAARR